MGNKPLEGIKVVELSTFVAAPGCARILADLGADVIKVEGLTGDPWRERGRNIIGRGDGENPIYDVYNTGKRSIRVNIKDPKGFECLVKLIEEADVFITNTRAKSLKKLGLDAETLHERFPRLVIATIDGFGSKGPAAANPGFDNVAFWTRSGFLLDMVVDTDGSYPMLPPTGVGDSVAGSTMSSGIMAALFARERTGKGDIVAISLYGTAIWVMGGMVIRAQPKYGEKFPQKREEANPFITQYRCGDGQWVTLTVIEYARYCDAMYKTLGIYDEVTALGVTDYQSLQPHKAEVIKLMENAFAKKPMAEWLELLAAQNIVVGKMNHFRDVSEDEQAWANGFIEEYETANGEKCIMPCTPIRLASTEQKPGKPAPLSGENTVEILKELGYAEQEINEMLETKAVL